MGRRMTANNTTETPGDQSLTWRLSDPGMDLLERAGLAGLYMALRAACETQVDLSPLTWTDTDLTTESVTVHWTGSARPAFGKLIEWAWQVADGVLYLPAIHAGRERAQFHLRMASHNGIMRTFLQHTNVQPKGETIRRIVQLDENRAIQVSYQPPIVRESKARPKKESAAKKPARAPTPKLPGKLLKPWKDLDILFDSSGEFRSTEVELSNWVYPGIAGRYGGEGAWQGSPQRAILLMLAPTVCLFLRLQGEGGNWVFVVPDISDLTEFDDTRRRMSLDADFTDVASMGDAGLRFLAEYASRSPRQRLHAGCRVVAMGKVGYYASQSIRKAVLDVPPELTSVRRYRLLQGALPNTYVSVPVAEATVGDTKQKPRRKSKKPAAEKLADEPKAKGCIKLPAVRGRIADNLVNGRPWYENLLFPQARDLDELEQDRKKQRGKSLERLWFEAVYYQKSKLMKLIQEDAMWDTEAEKVFVEAFWETLKALYRREGEAARDRGGSRSATDRMEDLNEKVRRSLVQARTHSLLRERLTEFFSRPVKVYRSPTLARYAAVIWRLVDSDWKKGRDLALLALATYLSDEKRNATHSVTTEGD